MLPATQTASLFIYLFLNKKVLAVLNTDVWTRLIPVAYRTLVYKPTATCRAINMSFCCDWPWVEVVMVPLGFYNAASSTWYDTQVTFNGIYSVHNTVKDPALYCLDSLLSKAFKIFWVHVFVCKKKERVGVAELRDVQTLHIGV